VVTLPLARYTVGISIGTSKVNTISLEPDSFGKWAQTRGVAAVGAGLARLGPIERARAGQVQGRKHALGN